MRSFAGLEFGIAQTALVYFVVIALFGILYPAIHQNIAFYPLRFVVKVMLAVVLILPPAFFMGGTVPMMGQSLIRSRRLFGSQAAGLYAINTRTQ
jgi:spermidine synthase